MSNERLPPAAVHHLVEGKQTNSGSPFSHYGIIISVFIFSTLTSEHTLCSFFVCLSGPSSVHMCVCVFVVMRFSPLEHVRLFFPLSDPIYYVCRPCRPSLIPIPLIYPSCFPLVLLLLGRIVADVSLWRLGRPHFLVTEFGRWQRDGKPIDFDAGVRGRRQSPDLSCQEFHDPRSGHGRFRQTRRPL